jgi:[protein-PII] uridylyltransferase
MVDAYKRERAIQVSHEEMIGCHQVTFCAPDRPHLFADLAGLLLSEGFNILAARLYSRSDGIALDLFQVVIADKLKVDVPKRVDNLRRKLERIEKGTVKISELITDRWRRYRLNVGRRPIYPPRVEFHDELSRKCTVVEVDAGDRPGLLYDLATTIADLGLDLRTAKVSTMIDRARDVFHVVDRDGNKVVSTPRRQEIIEALSRAADWRDLSASEAEKPAASYPPSTVAAAAPSRAPRPIDSEDPPAEAGTR